MSSKEEKLASARKKLKEFQNRQRGSVVRKTKVAPQNTVAAAKDLTKHTPSQSPSSCTSESSPSFHEHTPGKDQSEVEKKLTVMSDTKSGSVKYSADPLKYTLPIHDQDVSGNSAPNVMFAAQSNVEFIIDGVKVNESAASHANGLSNGEGIIHAETGSVTTLGTSDLDKIKLGIDNFPKDTKVTMKEIQNDISSGSLLQDSITNPAGNDIKDSRLAINISGLASNETGPQKKVVTELSVSELVEENANLSELLKRTQELLKYKTGEEQHLSEEVSSLQLRVKDLEGSVLNAQNKILELKEVNEELTKYKESHNNMLEEIKQKYESKVEEYLELQQKLKLKTKEYENLYVTFQETQNQLSSSLIKVQQLNIGEPSVLYSRMTELEDENASLTAKIKSLERNLRSVNKEKEESSHSFQNYAQQCNTQLKTLSSEVKTLAKENRSLTQVNKMLEKKLNDLECEKVDLKVGMENLDLKSLIDEKNELKDDIRALELRLEEKTKLLETLKRANEGKLDEINLLLCRIDRLESENVQLMEDRERSDRNEKLLAAMESDKIAAATAVAQNQKLKEQVYQLEEALMRLGSEKLQIANELAHEKHAKELMERHLQSLPLSKRSDREVFEKVTNDSSDVNELRKIIRQLEQDKTELLLRLRLTGHRETIDKSTYCKMLKDGPEGDETFEVTLLKSMLEQMEEKLKKTMQELAYMDEEKEKLEHIVLQLQCENETIEEYISLYHKQRLAMHKRCQEKEEKCAMLMSEKEDLQGRLTILGALVNSFLQAQKAECEEARDVCKIAVDHKTKEYSEATAEKIQNLISEIQSTNLIDNQSVGFEHCSCCSGRLITV